MFEDQLPPTHFWYRNILLDYYYTKDHIDRYLDKFQFREKDIVLVTYPRSGTLLTQEIIWQIKHRRFIQSGKNYGPLLTRFPYIEVSEPDDPTLDAIEFLEKKPECEQRFIKTHMPQHAIFNKIQHCEKIVLVYREVKDVAASFYNFYHSFKCFDGWPHSWDEFFQCFIEGRVLFGSYFEWNAEWLKKKNLPNLHVIKYEDYVKDKVGTIKQLAEFLNEADITDKEIDIIVENTSFNKMYSNKDVNISLPNEQTMMRKGTVGDHKNYFSSEQERIINTMWDKFISPLQ